MKKKIVGIFVCMLLIATAVSGITAGIDVKNSVATSPTFDTESLVNQENVGSMQPPEVEWHKTYGGSNWDYLYCAHETDDHGYIACGATTYSGIFYPWVLKVDSDGIEEWNWTTTTAYFDGILLNITESQVPYVQQTDDGGYIACLWTWVTYNRVDYIIGGLVKLDAMGSEEWIIFHGEAFETSMIPASFLELDDGFLVVGSEGPDLDEYYPAMMMKTNETGVEQWKKTYDYSDYSEELWSILSIDDGYICTGCSEVIGNVDQSVFLMLKTDKNGNEQWHKTYGGSEIMEWSWSRRCFETSDGGYIMAGGTDSYGAGDGDLWIVQTDVDGNMVWNDTFGETKRDVCWSFDETDDGYVFAVCKNFWEWLGDKEDIWIIKTDEDGNAQWSQIFGGSGSQIASYISKTSDGGFILAGRTGTWGSPLSDALLVKLGPDVTRDLPELTVRRPKARWIYLWDIIGLPILITPNALVLGDLTFKAQAEDASGIDMVEFFIDGLVVGETNETQGLLFKTYNYEWTGAEKGTYNLKIRAYNTHGGTAKNIVTIQKL